MSRFFAHLGVCLKKKLLLHPFPANRSVRKPIKLVIFFPLWSRFTFWNQQYVFFNNLLYDPVCVCVRAEVINHNLSYNYVIFLHPFRQIEIKCGGNVGTLKGGGRWMFMLRCRQPCWASCSCWWCPEVVAMQLSVAHRHKQATMVCFMRCPLMPW